MPLVLVMYGCDAEQTSTAVQELVGEPTCVDATAYPGCIVNGSPPCAIPNDNTDDTTAINNAIAAAVGGTSCATSTNCPYSNQTCSNGVCVGPRAVCFPAGVFDATRPPVVNSARVNFDLSGGSGSGQISDSDLAFYGAGPDSIIRMYDPTATSCETECVGDPAPCIQSPWYMFRIRDGASRIRIKNLTLTTGGIAQYDEQTFPLLIGTPTQTTDVSDILVENVRITNSCEDDLYITGNGSGGSGGGSGGLTRDIRVRRSTFASAGRRGITLKNGLQQGLITDNIFELNNLGAINVDDTDCSFPCVQTTSDYTVSRNMFLNSPGATIWHIQVNGTDSSQTTVDRVVISDNTLIGGGIDGATVSNLTIRNNVIVGPVLAPADADEVKVGNLVDGLSISGNLVFRTSAVAAPVVLVWKDTLQPKQASVRANVIVSSTASPSVEMLSVVNQDVSDNLIVQLLSGTATASAIEASASGPASANVTSARIEDNVVIGSNLMNGVLLDAAGGATFADVLVRGNLITGEINGVMFARDALSSWLQYPTISRNIFDGASTEVDFDFGSAGLSSSLANAYVVGGNGGGPQEFVGDGSAGSNVSPPDGSMYLRRDVAGGSHLFMRQGGAWVGK